jgi:hypothetical protein
VSNVDVYRYDGISAFTLKEPNPIAITEVLVNGVSSGYSYSFDASANRVTVTGAFLTDDLVEIEYTCYLNYSNSQILSYIQSALDYLSIYLKTFIIESSAQESGTDIILPRPCSGEESLIAIITAILINPQNRTIAIPDVKITPAEKLSTDQIIQRQIALFKKRGVNESYGVV